MKPGQLMTIDQIEELDCATTDNPPELYGYSSDIRHSLDPAQMIAECESIDHEMLVRQ